MENIFMAQIHFLIPFRQVCRKCQKEHDKHKVPLKPSFAAKKHEMECHYSIISSKDFYFKSFPENSLCVAYRKVTVNTYLLGYKMQKSDKTALFFLVAGVKVDKRFEESYAGQKSTTNQNLQERICTERDLIYLQKAFYDSSKSVIENDEGLFFPLHSPVISLQQWISGIVADIEGKKARNIDFEYSVADVLSVNVQLGNNFDESVLTKKVAESYYAPNAKENSLDYKNKAFALCLLNGNININNVAPAEVREYGGHAIQTISMSRRLLTKAVFLYSALTIRLIWMKRRRKNIVPDFWNVLCPMNLWM